jgi:hypothetical protein
MIRVEKQNDRHFVVTVEEGGSSSTHTVSLDPEYYRELTKGKIGKEALIEKSFEFLLARESKESILSSFNLKVIERYFPEYQAKIRINIGEGG